MLKLPTWHTWGETWAGAAPGGGRPPKARGAQPTLCPHTRPRRPSAWTHPHTPTPHTHPHRPLVWTPPTRTHTHTPAGVQGALPHHPAPQVLLPLLPDRRHGHAGGGAAADHARAALPVVARPGRGHLRGHTVGEPPSSVEFIKCTDSARACPPCPAWWLPAAGPGNAGCWVQRFCRCPNVVCSNSVAGSRRAHALCHLQAAGSVLRCRLAVGRRQVTPPVAHRALHAWVLLCSPPWARPCRHLPLARDLVRVARQRLVFRLDSYCKRDGKLFSDVIKWADAEGRERSSSLAAPPTCAALLSARTSRCLYGHPCPGVAVRQAGWMADTRPWQRCPACRSRAIHPSK